MNLLALEGRCIIDIDVQMSPQITENLFETKSVELQILVYFHLCALFHASSWEEWDGEMAFLIRYLCVY